MPIAATFLHFFTFSSIAYLGRGALCHDPTLGKIRDKFKGKTVFLEITMFLGHKIDKTGTDSKRKTFFRNRYVCGTKN